MSNRRILRLSGAETRDFLQGLITNDVAKVDQGLVYAALLTPQGKYLADFFVAADGEDLLLDVDESLAASLAKRLTMYRLRAKITIEETDLAVRRGTGPAPEGALEDPRHPDLGWRLYGAEAGDDDSNWDAIRVAHCIPETGIELGPDSYILEAGFERLNGVDFRKGCYVGQEVTARMKHKTTLRKGLATVAVTGEAPVGTEIRRADKPVGTLFTQAGNQAIAYLRFDRAGDDMCAQDARIDWHGKT
ncbi:CAF17-like 4Fe-4S cluster assembly/insertion protein YgfZ [Phaeobacter gallaeciensis]|uniref:tRNA-modifying protein ygfZ-like protein n=1 Tax=Phaeobacter gallaeciensis TaxID=60890 RepID=A0AAC9Z7L4_9RHOB|nr:folate-binding protein YgfZ [Phaeobacter gallaeciensis]AHD08769.1 folate-binding protein YgfZ [Phaeobacter gallaeciensis DSM 26640]ATE92035.1 tRNA-modifying protein ygfZ-like protein [Phaeobacter gallaeciensis]ATE98141.1 tRNA-modifying protein ygfZ-like protein [Phaeobacter gallaeciensis]ATF00651.1 tRNA-modifying protein ygfZ-like protein [Phaeobacter gallaeciensis]ATF05082.1 tRNA-modifying protein ygfZ-like protein [Phaeobacter gallaeciensis]